MDKMGLKICFEDTTFRFPFLNTPFCLTQAFFVSFEINTSWLFFDSSILLLFLVFVCMRARMPVSLFASTRQLCASALVRKECAQWAHCTRVSCCDGRGPRDRHVSQRKTTLFIFSSALCFTFNKAIWEGEVCANRFFHCSLWVFFLQNLPFLASKFSCCVFTKFSSLWRGKKLVIHLATTYFVRT